MPTVNYDRKSCCKCGNDGATTACDGCRQSFCVKHATDHRRELSEQLNNISQQYDILAQDIGKQSINQSLFDQIDNWEKESIEKIRSAAGKARAHLRRLTDDSKTELGILMSKLSEKLRTGRRDNSFTEKDISQWQTQLEKLRKNLSTPSRIKVIEKDDSSAIRFLMIEKRDDTETDNSDLPSPNTASAKEKSSKMDTSDKLPKYDDRSTHRSEVPIKISISSSFASSTYPSMTFGLDSSSDQELQRLFKRLMQLHPMDKRGPMSGRCEVETSQMERFLTDTFGFRNIPGEQIVQGVKSFQLKRPPHSIDPDVYIYFPKSSSDAFVMTAKEIVDWQRSYKVYTSKSIKGMSVEFLYRALKGQSGDGEEAFRMKFVVRISTCPILMEFDAKLISRKLSEDWPNRIKLVSVTGIDFAGRKHDVGDILNYVSNWKDVFEVDHTRNEPALLNERDFRRKRGGPKGELYQDRLLFDLKYMARIRLQACDTEGVEIVVETGIGLGVFAGEHIGIAEEVQITTALAIRTVLEEDGPNYKNIRAVVFALPIMDEDNSGRTRNCFSDFVEHFQEPLYKGPISVLIADQDMHRLTVAIARSGFVVSQLNPADSHGVFGEYWQNRGPAVEEKLALTTLGLLVQHHLINPHVLDVKNYYLV